MAMVGLLGESLLVKIKLNSNHVNVTIIVEYLCINIENIGVVLIMGLIDKIFGTIVNGK